MTASETLHATCVAIRGRAVLLAGGSGSGKSDLALRLIDRGAALVSDDYTIVRRAGAGLAASAPPTIAGRIEVRGVGIVAMPAQADASVALLVALDEAPERMPDDPAPTRMLAGVAVPVVALAPLEPSAPMKVELALARFGLPRMSAPSRPKRILLVTGMSGAGKSTALNTFEDMGWETVDNLPLALLDRLLGSPLPQGAPDEERPLALGIDARTRGFDGEAVAQRIRRLHEGQAGGQRLDIEILFLDCTGAELIRRFSATRRRHPLGLDRPAEDGIARERELLGPIRRVADHLIDTTDSTTNALQAELRARFGGEEGEAAAAPTLSVLSFGFARGVPRNADLVFDMRFLRNPHWVDELRPLTGLDRGVADHVSADPAYAEALERIEGLLRLLLPRYRAEGKSYVTVAFGCTGGRHRSVHCAEEIARRLRQIGFSPRVSHRDLPAGERATDAPPGPGEGGRRSDG